MFTYSIREASQDNKRQVFGPWLLALPRCLADCVAWIVCEYACEWEVLWGDVLSAPPSLKHVQYDFPEFTHDDPFPPMPWVPGWLRFVYTTAIGEAWFDLVDRQWRRRLMEGYRCVNLNLQTTGVPQDWTWTINGLYVFTRHSEEVYEPQVYYVQ